MKQGWGPQIFEYVMLVCVNSCSDYLSVNLCKFECLQISTYEINIKNLYQKTLRDFVFALSTNSISMEVALKWFLPWHIFKDLTWSLFLGDFVDCPIAEILTGFRILRFQFLVQLNFGWNLYFRRVRWTDRIEIVFLLISRTLIWRLSTAASRTCNALSTVKTIFLLTFFAFKRPWIWSRFERIYGISCHRKLVTPTDNFWDILQE